MFHRCAKVVLALGLAVAVAGCASKISKANFERIKPDMTEKEVEKLLGQPARIEERDPKGPPEADRDDRMVIWQDGSRVITIGFRDGKVVSMGCDGL